MNIDKTTKPKTIYIEIDETLVNQMQENYAENGEPENHENIQYLLTEDMVEIQTEEIFIEKDKELCISSTYALFNNGENVGHIHFVQPLSNGIMIDILNSAQRVYNKVKSVFETLK